MQKWRVLSTAGVIAAITVCAVTVVAFAVGQPDDRHASASTSSSSVTPTRSESTDGFALPASGSKAPTKSAATQKRSSASPTRTTTAPPATQPTTKAAPPPKPTAPPLPRGQSLPLGDSTGNATRVVTVVAPSDSSTTATLQAWNKAAGGGWLRYGAAVTAHVGSDGVTTSPSEQKSATPAGSFTLTQAFGALANPGTGLPYFKTDASDWWISQAGSLYNTHQRCASGCSFTQGNPNEHLYYETPYYNYAVVIDANRFPVHQGAGSAFFLHVTDGKATAGCVAIPQATLVTLMKWLTPSTHPRILIGTA